MIDDFEKMLGALRDLSRAELLTLDAAVRGLLSAPPSPAATAAAGDMPDTGSSPSAPSPSAAPPLEGIAAIEAAFALEPVCPECQSTRVGKWGSANRLRRYRCKDCKVSFNCLTGTPLAQLHKRELWSGHAQALVDGISLRKVAARLDVHLTLATVAAKDGNEVDAALEVIGLIDLKGRIVTGDALHCNRRMRRCTSTMVRGG